MENVATDFDQLALLIARRRAEGASEIWLQALAVPPRRYYPRRLRAVARLLASA